jgi:hypothetical protein
MNHSIKAALLTAAASGLLAGATAAHARAISPSGTKAFAVAGTAALGGTNAQTEKHACKGQNSCKGQGGCKSGDNGCKGKNSCKGKGGCATNGSHNSCSAMV